MQPLFRPDGFRTLRVHHHPDDLPGNTCMLGSVALQQPAIAYVFIAMWLFICILATFGAFAKFDGTLAMCSATGGVEETGILSRSHAEVRAEIGALVWFDTDAGAPVMQFDDHCETKQLTTDLLVQVLAAKRQAAVHRSQNIPHL